MTSHDLPDTSDRSTPEMSDPFLFENITTDVTATPATGGGLACIAHVDVTSGLSTMVRTGVEVVCEEAGHQAWFGTPEPKEFALPAGDTQRIEITVTVPGGAPAGTTSFTIRAFDVGNPMDRWAVSQPVTVTVPEQERPPKPPWALIAAGVVAAILLGVVGFIVFSGGGTTSLPSVVGLRAEDARAALAEVGTVNERRDPELVGDGCVLFQTPAGGVESDVVDVLLTSCPAAHPNVAVPAITGDLCNRSFPFCRALERDHGEDFLADPTWVTASTDMLEAFLDAFTIPGSEVPGIVGMTIAEARATAGSFAVSGTPDDSGCVLFQHPFAGRLEAADATITAVTTTCPAAAQTAAQVSIDTSADLTSFANVCQAHPAFCAAVAADGSLPEGFIAAPEFADVLSTQVVVFRNTFTDPRIPDVDGLRLGNARTQLEALGLEVQTLLVNPADPGPADSKKLLLRICTVVVGQTPPPGTRVADMTNPVVSLSYEARPLGSFGCGLVVDPGLVFDTARIRPGLQLGGS